MFDWRQLKRFGIAEHRLPAGSLVKMRKLGIWDLYAREISAGIAVIVLEGLLVAGLVVQLRRRRRVERRLADAETRYRTVADFTHNWEFWQRSDGSFDYVSPACERVSGHPRIDFERKPELPEAIVLDEDRPAWRAHQADALAGKAQPSLEYRIRTRDGCWRWHHLAWHQLPPARGILPASLPRRRLLRYPAGRAGRGRRDRGRDRLRGRAVLLRRAGKAGNQRRRASGWSPTARRHAPGSREAWGAHRHRLRRGDPRDG